MIRILPIIVLLTGCASSAIQVTEVEGQCTLSGAMFTPTVLEQTPPETDSQYKFEYTGDKCSVTVTNGEIEE